MNRVVHNAAESKITYARVLGSPGENARAAGLFRTLWPVFALVGLTGYLLGAAMPIPGVPVVAYGICLILLAVVLVRAVYGSQNRLRGYFKGARGEEQAARLLALLPGDYTVFHSVSIPGAAAGSGDLDHVVIGPNGLFLIETKNWSSHIGVRDGRLLVDGKASDYSPVPVVKQSAARLHDWLKAETGHSVAIRSVLYFVASEIRGGKTDCDGVVVTGGEALRDFILRDRADELNEGLRTALSERLALQVPSLS